MPPAGFKPTIPASQLPQTHPLNRAATGIGYIHPIPTDITFSIIEITEYVELTL